MKNLSKLLLKLTHWTAEVDVEIPPKSIVCVAPHTSNWDFILGKLFAWKVGLNAGFLMKKSWFFFPLNLIFKAMGGIPIDRSKNTSTVRQMIEEFDKRKTLHIAITPEGTRKLNKNWKLGFYYIAVDAKVPILLAYIDYKNKEVKIPEIFYPTNDKTADLRYIYNFYKGHANAKFPERFSVPTTYK